MLRKHVPWHDERFRGYGRDKVRALLALCMGIWVPCVLSCLVSAQGAGIRGWGLPPERGIVHQGPFALALLCHTMKVHRSYGKRPLSVFEGR